MTYDEKEIAKIKLKKIIEYFREKGTDMNGKLLAHELMMTYPTLAKVLNNSKIQWTPKTRTKISDYIAKFEQEHGTIAVS